MYFQFSVRLPVVVVTFAVLVCVVDVLVKLLLDATELSYCKQKYL